MKSLIEDTLKKEGRYDSKSIMRFVAFNSSVLVFLCDYFKFGFRLESWVVMITYSFGQTLLTAQAKKLEK
jgi:hypothetical protein